MFIFMVMITMLVLLALPWFSKFELTDIHRLVERAKDGWCDFRRKTVSIEYDFDSAAVMTCRVDGNPMPVTGKPGRTEQVADIRAEIDSRIFSSFSRRVTPRVQVITRVDESAPWHPVIFSMCCNEWVDPFRVVLRDAPGNGKTTQELILPLAGDRTPNDLWAEVFPETDNPRQLLVKFTRRGVVCGVSPSTEHDLPATIAALVRVERAAGRLDPGGCAQVILHTLENITAKDAARHILMMKIPEVDGITWAFDDDEEVVTPPAIDEGPTLRSHRQKTYAPSAISPVMSSKKQPPPR